MSAEFPIGIPIIDAPRRMFVSQRFADKTLRAAAKFWFVITVACELAFAFATAAFYGLTAARGDMLSWSRHLSHGYIAGDARGNIAVIVHLASAVIVLLAGAIQFIPQIRVRYPAFHRWNGRLYVLTVVTLSTAGLYMTWILKSVGDIPQHLGSTLNAVLMWIFAFMTVRYAIARDFGTHRRWALRMFVVVNATLVIRAMVFMSFVIFKRPFGFDPLTFTGPFLTFVSFAQTLLPLAVLELYFFAQRRPGTVRRLSMAVVLFVLTLGMATGIAVTAMAVWVPNIKAAFDDRKSIGQTLLNTIASRGVDAGIRQYREIKASGSNGYKFERRELNMLGYQLIREKKLKAAIRIFQLNVEAFPQSANVYDSLGEGYIQDGNKNLAIANYRKALQLDPKSLTAAAALKKLGVAH